MSERLPVVVTKRPDGIGVITLNNPPLNLRTMESTELMEKAIKDLDADDRVRVVVITGCRDSRAFCAGSDIKEFPALRARGDMTEVKTRRENAMFSRVENMKKPVVASLNGLAYGGGFELALACDFRIIDETARIRLPEINLGSFAAGGASVRLVRLITYSRVLEIMYFATILSAAEALELGLVNRVAPAGRSLEESLKFAYEIARKPWRSVQALKAITRAALTQTNEENIAFSIRFSDAMMGNPDGVEGSAAFLEKREPRFEGAPTEFYTEPHDVMQ